MLSFRFAIAAAMIAASFGITAASALEIDQGSSNKASVNLSDPDDKIPFPHLDDDGSAQSSSGFNFQTQGNNSGSVGFGFTPANANPSAFERAQNRMQQ